MFRRISGIRIERSLKFDFRVNSVYPIAYLCSTCRLVIVWQTEAVGSVPSFLKSRSDRAGPLSGESCDEKFNAIKRKVCFGRCISRFGRSRLALSLHSACWPSLNLSSAYEEKSHRSAKSARRCMANFNPFKLRQVLSRTEYHLIILTKGFLRIPLSSLFFCPLCEPLFVPHLSYNWEKFYYAYVQYIYVQYCLRNAKTSAKDIDRTGTILDFKPMKKVPA